jgi:3D (Asp-Asp-Asp) domain-containing protein
MIAFVIPLLVGSTVQAQASPTVQVPTQSTPVTLNTIGKQTSPSYHFTSAEKAVTQTEKLPSEEHSEVRTMILTAYTKADKSMNGRGLTASGVPVQEGVTIAAPPNIPFGSKIYIPVLNHTYTVTDRGGAIRGDHLDLFMKSSGTAVEFGKKRLKVVITTP